MAFREPFERCVMCGKITNVLRSTPIEERSCYVGSAGQLCFQCYESLYLTDDPSEEKREKILTTTVMQMLRKNNSNHEIKTIDF